MGKINITFITNAPVVSKALQDLHNRISSIQTKLSQVNRVSAKATNTQSTFINVIKQGWKTWFVYSVAVYGAIKAIKGLQEFIGDGINKFREFQTRIIEVATIMDKDWKESIIGLREGVESLALQFGKDTSDISKGLYDILSAAFDAKQAIGLLGTATKAAIAGLSGIRESVDIFTTVLNSYGMSAFEASRVSDMLFQSVIRGKFQFEDLNHALGYVVPIAAQAGISFQELMAALSTVTRHGLHLDMTARGLALAIQNIINPSEQAKEAAEKYGIALDGVTLRVKGLRGFFEELNEKTKEFGNSILNELIPNMRSLRVAMVLAGDEGLEGMMDDFERLSVSAGRTEEALQKVMNTSQFVANQIKEQWEKEQRDIGEQWDKIALGAQSAILQIVKHWTFAIPLVGAGFASFQGVMEHKFKEWVADMKNTYRVIGGELFDVSAVQSYLGVLEKIQEVSKEASIALARGENVDEYKKKLIVLQNIATDLKTSFDKAFGEPILGGIRNLEELKQTMVEIESHINTLKERLEKPIQTGWGNYAKTIKGTLNLELLQLKATQKRIDYEHDVQSALKLSNYEWKTNNEELKNAVKYVKNYTEAQKELQQSLRETNNAMRELELEALKIQLKGMLRRRGLTRSEQIKLKKIRIEQTKLRIQQMEEEINAVTELDRTEYEKRKQFIDDFLEKLREEEYQIKYTFDQQITDLESHIEHERNLLDERYKNWEDTHNKILTNAQELMDKLENMFSDELLKYKFKELLGIDIGEISLQLKSIYSSESEKILFPKFQRGGYVPETGLALVHKGEYIIPAGGSSKIGNINIHVNINAVTKEGVTADDIADKVATAIQQKLIDFRSGKTKFRVR